MMAAPIVITGIGMITPLGCAATDVLRRMEAGERAAAAPTGFAATPFACPWAAEVKEFRPQDYLPEAKMIRLMNRDAQLAVAAARRALLDAQLKAGVEYAPEEIAVFGASGMAGLPFQEVAPLVNGSAAAAGQFDLRAFGQRGLRGISPLLSFKVLANMPVCFVSIANNIQGVNAIYTPWEGQGAQAIEAGLRALRAQDARVALVGGCDVKTHELAFISLEQQGVFESWRKTNRGTVPGEGAVFLVLETEADAQARGARRYAQITGWGLSTCLPETERNMTCALAVRRAAAERQPDLAVEAQPSTPFSTVIGAADDDVFAAETEAAAFAACGVSTPRLLHPKSHAGNLFAAAALLQVALGAEVVRASGGPVLAACFGHGSEQAAFILDAA